MQNSKLICFLMDLSRQVYGVDTEIADHKWY